MRVYNARDYRDFGFFPSSGILKNITFRETVSETSCSLEYRTMDEVQIPSNFETYNFDM
jgi:hypothetical protein